MPRPAFAEASLHGLLCLATVEGQKCTIYDWSVFHTLCWAKRERLATADAHGIWACTSA